MAVTGLASGSKLIGKLFGNAVSSAVGFGAGVAMAPALGPVVRDISNAVNSKYAFVFPEPGTLANGVSQGQISREKAGRWASYWGVGDTAFSALVDIANTGPGVPTAFDLWRRNVIDEAGFRTAAKRQGLEANWIEDLVKIKQDVLDPAQLAAAVHRGIIPDPGLLVGDKPGPDRKVPVFPQVDINAEAEAEASGYDLEHLRALVGLQGLPMGSHEAAQAAFRGVITHDDYLAAIAQGNTRNEWADAILEQSRQIPTTHEFVENALRGYSTLADAIAGGAKHGMTEEYVTMVYQNAGRPMNLHQITTGLARGGTFKPEPGEITDPYMASIVEGSLKPAYYDLAFANRYQVPSAFAIRALAQSGVWDEAKVRERLLWSGWIPEDAAQVAKAWTKTGTGSAKEATVTDLLKLYDGGKATLAETLAAIEDLGYPAAEAQAKVDTVDAGRVVSAKSAAIGDLHTKYKKGELPDANVAAALSKLGVAAWAVPKIVDAWRAFLDAEAETPPTALPPTVTSFAPLSGPAGSSVTLTGRGFTGTSAVTLGATAATFHVVSDTQITATVPAGALSAQWVVTTPGGTGASGNAFNVA